MFYITDTAPELTSYWLRKEKDVCVKLENPLALPRLLSEKPELLVDENTGEFYLNRTSSLINMRDSKEVVSVKEEPSNDVYVCVKNTSPYIKKKKIELLTIDENYCLSLIKDSAFILDNDSLTWLISKYKNAPNKLLMEMDALLLLFIKEKRRLRIEDVHKVCGGETSQSSSYLTYMGSKKGSLILRAMSNSSCWLLLDNIGNYLISLDRCPDLYAYISPFIIDIKEGVMDTRYGLIIMNEWLRQNIILDRSNPYHWEFKLIK
jgi:hypothetical protein